MSQLPFVATTNKICEAYGCDNLATTQIEVQAGKYGTIPLNLCTDCVELFEVNPNNPEFKQKIRNCNHPEGVGK
jgi:hypothetical protein